MVVATLQQVLDIGYQLLASFHPEMVLLPNPPTEVGTSPRLNRRPCLCDVLQYVSAQALDFFAPLRVLSPQSLRFGSPVSSHRFGCSVPNRSALGPRFLRTASGAQSPIASLWVPGFLDLEQKSSFPIWKLRCTHPAFPDGN